MALKPKARVGSSLVVCRGLLRVTNGCADKNGCADNMCGTSEVPQLADPLWATPKSAEMVNGGHSDYVGGRSGVPQIADDLLHGTKSPASGHFLTHLQVASGQPRRDATFGVWRMRRVAAHLTGSLFG
jgi:hypothetical protein